MSLLVDGSINDIKNINILNSKNKPVSNSLNTNVSNSKNKFERTKIKIKDINNESSNLKNKSPNLKLYKLVKPTCSICLDEIEIKDGLKIRSCGHIFHKDCISEWVDKRNNCPLCRTVVKRKFDIYEKRYKGFYKSQKRILIDDNYFYIFKCNHKKFELNKLLNGKKANNKKSNSKQLNSKKEGDNNGIKNIKSIKKREKMKKKELQKTNKCNEIIDLFNSDDENYIYHFLLSIIKLQIRGKDMFIQLAINHELRKNIKISFKNAIDSQNCFKLINDNIKKKKRYYIN
tara:strand:- start:5182 stop:6045 length:864 start_codon:yes stop_codon:yes gene_type:complete